MMRFFVQEGFEHSALVIADNLNLPIQSFAAPFKAFIKYDKNDDIVLVFDEKGLGLYDLSLNGAEAIRVDLQQGQLGFRLQQERARHEMVVKACGLNKYPAPVLVLDATAGLLRDTAVLAAAGAQVQVFERQPIIAALIRDGLQRAASTPELAALVAHIHFQQGNTLHYLQAQNLPRIPNIIYLDPMFPEREKSALVKKEMRIFKHLMGTDDDADELFLAAMAIKPKRVVVKRPKIAPPLAERAPSYCVEGKSGRFDVYIVL